MNVVSKLTRCFSPSIAMIVSLIMLCCSLTGSQAAPKCRNYPGPATYIDKNGPRYRREIFSKVDVRKDVVFGEGLNDQGEKVVLLLDVYTPAGDTAKIRPAVIWIHGGGFTGMDKQQNYVVTLCTAYAKMGYVAISPNYRLKSKGRKNDPDMIAYMERDVMSALRWARRNAKAYRIDKEHIGIGGGSAGGMLALNFCSTNNVAKAPRDRNGIFALGVLWGAPPSEGLKIEIDRCYPPTIVIHGTADQTVAYSNALTFHDELKRAGIRSELHPVEGGKHSLPGFEREFVDASAKFFFEMLTSYKNER